MPPQRSCQIREQSCTFGQQTVEMVMEVGWERVGVVGKLLAREERGEQGEQEEGEGPNQMAVRAGPVTLTGGRVQA